MIPTGIYVHCVFAINSANYLLSIVMNQSVGHIETLPLQ